MIRDPTTAVKELDILVHFVYVFVHRAGIFCLGFPRAFFPTRVFYLWFFPWRLLGSFLLNFVLVLIFPPAQLFTV